MVYREEIISCHFCSKREIWVRPSNPFSVFRLPEGWTKFYGGRFVCPACNSLLEDMEKQKHMPKKDPFKEMVLKFVETAIKRINQSLALNYATQQALIEAGLISNETLKKHISEALKLPNLRIGREALLEMFGDYTKENTNFIKDPSDVEEKKAIEKIMDMMA